MTTNKPHILVLDDEEDILRVISKRLRDSFEVKGVSTLDDARSVLFRNGYPAEFSVVVVDMRLQEGGEDGLTLIQELNEREVRPEVVVLTAHGDIPNASKCMQAGAFGYVEKGREDTFSLLKELCLKADKRWHERFRRIPDTVLGHPIALLFGDVVPSTDLLMESDDEAWGIEEALRRVIRREIKVHGGQLTKLIAEEFFAIFDTAAEAVETAIAIQKKATDDTATSPSGQFRQSIHWGEVERLRMQKRDDITGTTGLKCVRLVETAKSGQVVISQEARDVLSPSDKVKLHDLGEIAIKGMSEPNRVYEVIQNVG